MKVLDLFSGIGGFSLGLERAGMETIAFCEIEDYPVKILNKHWPDIPVFRDVRKLTKEVLLNEVSNVPDIIVGGFPCQPFSVAGKQKGKEDDRHLWPEMFRLIKEIRPRWVIGENVAGFIRMALDDVLHDLESEGYTTQSFVIPACSVGGIHRRDRVWIIAHTSKQGLEGDSGRVSEGEGLARYYSDASNHKHSGRDGSEIGQGNPQRNDGDTTRQETIKQFERCGCSPDVTDTNNQGLQRKPITGSNGEIREKPNDQQSTGCDSSQQFRPISIPTEPPVRHRDDGIPDNVARLKALGNAVVPQIPEMIGRAIMKIENQ